MYCDDEDTGKKVLFNKDHMEGMIFNTKYCCQFPFNKLILIIAHSHADLDILLARFQQRERKPSLCCMFRAELSSNRCCFF